MIEDHRGAKPESASEADLPDSRPLLLDLFCCAGGAAKGYDDAGFDVFGVDVIEQPNYPYPMMVADATALPSAVLDQFDAVHASPPCKPIPTLRPAMATHTNGRN